MWEHRSFSVFITGSTDEDCLRRADFYLLRNGGCDAQDSVLDRGWLLYRVQDCLDTSFHIIKIVAGKVAVVYACYLFVTTESFVDGLNIRVVIYGFSIFIHIFCCRV